MTPSRQSRRDEFAEKGFLIVPGLFRKEEVKTIKTQIQTVLDEVRREAIDAGRDPEKVINHGVYVGLAVHSSFFRQAVCDERLVSLMEAAIGPNVEFISDKVVFKSHDQDYGTPWHQDWSYWYGSHKVTAWVALDDATPDNGCLRLVPGSHRMAVNHEGDASDGKGFVHRLDANAVDENQVVTATMEAGGVVVFHDLLLHASYQNVSGRDRWCWLPTYRDARAEDPEYAWAQAATVVRGSKSA